MSDLRKIDELVKDGSSLRGKKVILRADFNVPVRQGKVADNTRIARTVPTIKALSDNGAKVIIISHFGRPDGTFNNDLSMSSIVDSVSKAVGKEVYFGVDCIGNSAITAVENLEDGEVVLLENLRFHRGEKENSPEFARQLADLGDIYVNDAFSCSHRGHASITGITEYLPSYAGYLLVSEIEHLQSALDTPERPVVAIVGGSKISTKIEMLESLVTKVDYLLIGGGMANTFLHAKGYPVGTSLCEKDLADIANKIMEKANEAGCHIALPVDTIISEQFRGNEADYTVHCHIAAINNIPDNMMIVDIGPKTAYEWTDILNKCKTVLWNGPLGAFELSPFDGGTVNIARVISGLTSEGKLKSVAGGGDILSALSHSGLRDTISYISTAGGAFLEWLEGKELPGIKVLKW